MGIAVSELVEIQFHRIMQTRTYTVIVLGTDEKQFAIYADPSVGNVLQVYLSQKEKPRPYVYDMILMIFQGLEITVKQVVITDVQETIYYARLYIEQRQGDRTHLVEIDTRPSDGIILALLKEVPLYCTREVLEKSITLEDF